MLPTHLWGIINMFRDIPAWSLYLDLWDLSSTISYVLTFALIESLVVFLLMLAFGFLLPLRWIKGRFVGVSGLFMAEGALLAILLQHHIRQNTARQIIPFLPVFLALLVVSFGAVLRAPKLSQVLRSIAQRLGILAAVYLAFDLVALLIVVVRNL